jgi:RNA polymerase sigma-70 factor (ECF subfamily)
MVSGCLPILEWAMASRARERTSQTARADIAATAELLRQVRDGDLEGGGRLIGRYVPVLQRWARGRLPAGARNLAETDDLVQITLIRAMNRVEAFEPRREGAFLAYLRKILLNLVREEARKGARIAAEPLSDGLPDPRSPEIDGGRATLDRYEAALETLGERQRLAAVLRLEFGYSYAQIAEAVGCPTAEGARKVVERALVRLATAMERGNPAAAVSHQSGGIR